MKKASSFALASLVSWLPFAALTIALTGMIYIAVQQSYRSTANDPQIQMATDARNALNNGAIPQNLVPSNTIDLAQSLSPYLIIYDKHGQSVASSATLHGQVPTPPQGVFQAAQTSDMDVLTWMPDPQVRSAIVVVSYTDGYVLAGRSLQKVEERESNLEGIVGRTALATLVGTYLAVALSRFIRVRLPVEMQ